MAPRGLPALLSQVAQLPTLVQHEVYPETSHSGEDLLAEIKGRCQVPQIAAHISLVPAERGAIGDPNGTLEIKAVTSIEGHRVYDPCWEEWGTHPHSIAAGADLSRGKRQDLGGWHPGARARPYFWPGVRAWRGNYHVTVVTAGIRAGRSMRKPGT